MLILHRIQKRKLRLSTVRGAKNFLRQLATQLGTNPIESTGRTIPKGAHKTTVLHTEEGYLSLEWWPGSASCVFVISLHCDWQPTKAVRICRQLLEPEKVEAYPVTPIGELYKWQPGNGS